MSRDENLFLQRFTNLLVRQEQQLSSGFFPIAPKDSGFKSIAEILGSPEVRDNYSKQNKEDEV